MGLLGSGVWRDEWCDTKSQGGAFLRPDTSFHGRERLAAAAGSA